MSTTPASSSGAAAGSVGTVDTQFLELPAPLKLDCGKELHPVRIAYETYGKLSPARDNVILVCHALSGDAHAAGFAAKPAESSTRPASRADERAPAPRQPGLVGRHDRPGEALTQPAAVVGTNLLGGCRGTTGPDVDEPGNGPTPRSRHAVADMVRAARLMDEIGIRRLRRGGGVARRLTLGWAVTSATT